MKNCPYCGTPGDFYFMFFSRIYHRCLRCRLIYIETLESNDRLIMLYRTDYFKRYSADQIEGKRDRLFEHILDLIEKRWGIGRLLDVGTGCGFFLVAAQKRGWEAKGIDPSKESVEVARRHCKFDVFNITLGEYSGDGKFDVITFINVLDHSSEPWKEIEQAKKLLKSGGLIFIRFPNGFLHALIYQLAFKFGLANRVRKFLIFHQYSFTPKYIKRLLSDLGFSEITILNSPPSEGDPHNLFFNPTFAQYIKKSLYILAKTVEAISGQKILLGTSLEVTAIKI